MSVEQKDENWEKQTIQKLLFAVTTEQRRKRRWGIFFKLLIVAYILGVTLFWLSVDRLGFSVPNMETLQHTAVIDVEGGIYANENASADNIIAALRSAFKTASCKGIILRINSPGGSPVQARQVFNEIKRLKAEDPDFPIYAAIEDIGTSAAYLIASAADQIYADETSLVGSIGVAFSSFGAAEAINKIGVERRLYTSGEHKGMLDPFLPADSKDVAFIQNSLAEVHELFIDNVKAGRGNKLKVNSDLFSGRFWTGSKSKEYGLIDKFGDKNLIAREVFHASKLVTYSETDSMLDRLSKKFGVKVNFANELLPQLR